MLPITAAYLVSKFVYAFKFSVFMIMQYSPGKPTPVIWCDYGDMYYYSIHKKFQYPHDEWPSFTAFFEYLIEQEEKALEAGKE